MTAELVILIPAVLLTLVIVVNAGMFFAEAARFDRVVCEVSRAMITSPSDPSQVTNAALSTALGYENGKKGPYRASVEVESDDQLFLKKRTLSYRLDYELFGVPVLSSADASAPGILTRKKTLVIFWSTGL